MRGGDLVCDFDAKILEQIDKSVGKEGVLGEGAFGKAFVVLEKIDTETDTQSLVSTKNNKYVVKELKISELENQKTELENQKKILENKKKILENKKKILENKKNKITEEIKQITEEIENIYNDAKKEAEILQQLSTNPHPNILKYIGCNDTTAKQFYIVTEYNEGYISLFDFINKTVSSNKDGFQLTKTMTNEFIKHFSTNFVSNIIQSNSVMQKAIINKCITQLYDGLWAIHKREVFHRDIKPENIIIDPKTGNIKYIDFGLSSMVNDVNKNNIKIAGTLDYIPYKGKLTIENISETILDVYLSNDADMTNVLIYIDYWGLAFTIYIMLFCRNKTDDSDDERYTNGWDGDGDGDIQKGGNNTDSCVDNILDNDIFKYFYTNNQYYPEKMKDNFEKIDTVLGPLNIPHYIPVSDILYTVEGKFNIKHLLNMLAHFWTKY